MASSNNSNKRKIPSNFNDAPRAPKRRRRRPRSKRPQSKVFSNKEDLEQFQTIFHSVKYSELASDSMTPISIIQEIAEYATGDVKGCAASTCDHKVVVLKEDSCCGCGVFRHDSYRHDGDMDLNLFYCSSCMLHLEWCEVCDLWIYIPDCTKCSECTVAIYDCNCDNETECILCSAVLCAECSHLCDGCDEIVCLECLSAPMKEKGVAFECEECHQSIPLQHKGCGTEYAIELRLLDSELAYCDGEECGNIVCLLCYGIKGETNIDDPDFGCHCKECQF